MSEVSTFRLYLLRAMYLFMVVGLAIFFLGLAIAYSNLIRDGGWPQFGAIVAILGAIDTVFAPRLLKRSWDRQDQQNNPE